MRNSLTLASLVLLSSNTTNCNLTGPVEHPETGFAHAVATMTCGPEGGSGGTGIVLARDSIPALDPPFPFVSVHIPEQVSNLRSLYLLALGDVSAQYFVSATEAEVATGGRIRIDRVSSANRIEGSVDLRFPGRSVTALFDAPWVESPILCR
jgi:hypothetical protein